MFYCEKAEYRQYFLVGLIDGDGHWSVKNKHYRLNMADYELVKQVKRFSLELGMHVGKIGQYDNYDHDGNYIGVAHSICMSGERVVDIFDKVALGYKKDGIYKRIQCASHWAFIMEETEEQQYYRFTTDGNNIFLPADNTVVHA
jgi:hypothetical protein